MDRADFEAEFESIRHAAARAAYKNLGDADLASEVAAAAVAATYYAGSTIKNKKAYAVRCANNMSITLYREWYQRVELREPHTFAESDVHRVHDIADAVAARDLVVRLLRSLPPEERRVILLHYGYGLKVREIAAHLNKSDNTIKKQISRGLAKLRGVASN